MSDGEEWGPVYSGAMTDCNDAMGPLHDRMPVLRVITLAVTDPPPLPCRGLRGEQWD